MIYYDVIIIGAGPSGAIASTLLNKKGYKVCVLEKGYFPRFVIGESLLPQCMEFIEEAGMLEAIENANFQYKDGAFFSWKNLSSEIVFADCFTKGKTSTYQVQRDKFDKILIDEAIKQGVEVRFGHQVLDFIDYNDDLAILKIETDKNEKYTLKAKFVLDASGYGRVLPKLLNLELPSCLPERIAYFTHIDDNITSLEYDRNKILISTHPQFRDVWLWCIPFSNGRMSIGVVGTPDKFNIEGLNTPENILKKFTYDIPLLKKILSNANWDNEVPFRILRNYSANVKKLYGRNFALLGNASEFLDPVFSSGITIAMYSSKLAAENLDKKFKGEKVNWKKDFEERLMIGVNAFRTYVLGWYNYSFQDVIYAKNINPNIRKMIISILAGYAWDTNNPFVKNSEKKLSALVALCEKL